MSAHPNPVILNVDDTDAQRYAVARTLEGAGFTVWQAASGQEALEKASQIPDLVILDIKLPDIDGFEVCRRIKSNPATAAIPVLHQSATFTDSQFRVTGLDGGADSYLVHPIEPEELLATVRALLRLRRAERELRESETRYRLMFDLSPMPCWLFDLDTLDILEINTAAINKYGYSREDFLKLKISDIRVTGGMSQLVEEIRANGGARKGGIQHRRRDGTLIEVEGSWQAIHINGKLLGLGIFNDLTEHKLMMELEAAARIRREVLGRVMATQEAERRSIARELHDEAGQLLTSLLAGLRVVSESKRLDQARRNARQLRSVAAKAMNEIGNLARGLHPTVLDDFGFSVALARLLAEYEKRHGIRITLKAGRFRTDKLPSATQISLYRVIQEALTNVVRHAQARSVELRFKALPEALEVTIADNGKGFDPSLEANSSGSHLGLKSMRERVALLGGELQIGSSPRGTKIIARIPASIPLSKPAKAPETRG